MYDFLKEAAGLDSKDEFLNRAIQEETEEIDPWWEEEESPEEDEDEEESYEWVWCKQFPLLTFNPYDDDIDWDCVTPNDFNELENYIEKIEAILSIDLPNTIYYTDLSELFLYVENNDDGTVTISVDRDALIDYLKEEC